MNLVDFLLERPASCRSLVCTTCGGSLAFAQRVRDYVADPMTPPVFPALCALPYQPDPRLRDCRDAVQSVIANLQLQPPDKWRDVAGAWARAADNPLFRSNLAGWLADGMELAAPSPAPHEGARTRDGRWVSSPSLAYRREQQLLRWIHDLRGVPRPPRRGSAQDSRSAYAHRAERSRRRTRDDRRGRQNELSFNDGEE